MNRIWKALGVFATALVLAFALTWPAVAEINAAAGSLPGTNFGTAIALTTLIPSVQGGAGSGNIVIVELALVQTTLGTTCGAGSNTATPTVAWTGPGGTAETLAGTALSESANGTLDTNQSDEFTMAVQMGSAVKVSVASSLASSGCTIVPQYTVFWRTY